jgi:hypothetical protein
MLVLWALIALTVLWLVLSRGSPMRYYLAAMPLPVRPGRTGAGGGQPVASASARRTNAENGAVWFAKARRDPITLDLPSVAHRAAAAHCPDARLVDRFVALRARP